MVHTFCIFSNLFSLYKDKDKDKDLFIGPQKFVVGYSKAPEQPQSSARPICHSHYDEVGARTSHHTHCCIGARRATHCATGDSMAQSKGIML